MFLSLCVSVYVSLCVMVCLANNPVCPTYLYISTLLRSCLIAWVFEGTCVLQMFQSLEVGVFMVTLCKHARTEFPEWSRREEKQQHREASTVNVLHGSLDMLMPRAFFYYFLPYFNCSFWFVMHSREKQMDWSSKSSLRSSCVKIYLCSNPEGKEMIHYTKISA